MDGDEPVGLTIGSFTSVSLDPPMVGFLPGKDSSTWVAIQQSGSFCVNVLGNHQADACWTFAKPAEGSRFDGLAWHSESTGSPVIDGSLAWIDCTINQVYEMGDHLFVLGDVTALAGSAGDPLLFFKGGLGTFAAS
jgi:flavin reductase (DIM6/NTAB) family NADH-FMN oxidoreductase RutF